MGTAEPAPATNLALLYEIAEYLEQHEDVIDGDGAPLPNTAMRLLIEVQNAIAILERP